MLAITAIISPALSLKFETAIILPRADRQARALVSLSLATVLVVSAVWAIFAELISRSFFPGDSVEALPLWVFVTSLFTGLFAVFSKVAVRAQQYSAIALRSVYQAVATALTQVVLGMLHFGQFGLLFGMLAGRVAGVGGLAVSGRRYVGRHSWRESAKAMREYWRFPAIFAPSSILNALGLQLPLLIIVSKFTVEIAGQLGMAERIVAVPIALLGAALGQVFSGELSRSRRENSGDAYRLFIRFSLVLAAFSVVILGALAALAPWGAPWLLGEKWSLTGTFVSIIAVTGAVRLVVNPLSVALHVYQRSRANVWLDVLRTVVMLASAWMVLAFPVSITAALWLLYGGLGVVYVVTWVYLILLLRSESALNPRGPEGDQGLEI